MNNQELISIFTPTYNRSQFLRRLYDSLTAQTMTNFEWIIVDDGSVDDTEDIVNALIAEDKIDIVYKKQKNQGKHIAINRGLELAKGDWFFIVDRDDYLLNSALVIVNKYICRDVKKKYAGFAFRRAFENKKSIGSNFARGLNEFEATIVERTVKFKIQGDMAEVFRTDLLRQCKFDEGIGEKFCAEGLMLNRTAKLGATLLYVDENIYICEYLPGGLTDNSVQNRRKSPHYATLVYKELAEIPSLPLKYKLKAYMNYWRFAFVINNSLKEKTKAINGNFWGIFSMPLGYVMKLKDDLKLKK